MTAAGPFRVMLFSATLVMIVCAPFALGQTIYEDWRIIPTVVIPVLAVLVFFLLPLDFLMSWVFALGDSERRARLRRMMWVEVALFAGLCAAWTPFVSALLPD
ncbi:MAG: hypothetical protein AAF458_22710 [Pseudomonadota bacterium]